MARTADDLIAGLKRRGIIPASQVLFDDTDLLHFADHIIESRLVPMLISVRQDYFVTFTDTDIIIDTEKYRIPKRAVARSVRDLKLVFDNGGQRDLQRFALEDEHFFQQSSTPQGFYFDVDNIILVPKPGNTGQKLRIFWECPPSRLVKLDQASVIQSATTDTLTLTNTPPDGIDTGVTIDVVRGDAGHSISHMDLPITGRTGATLNFAANSIDTTEIQAGDYVSVAQTAPVLQLPNECYSYLETMTAARYLHSQGDFEASGKLEDDGKEEARMLLKILEPRVRGESTKIINRRSLMRGTKGRYRRGLIY